ncbi:MAG: YebC/PmpR family DNA-binding transcriptional regulator [Bacteroidota bacterium]
MSGHNKWSTIKRKKGALDAKRSKIFSKVLKEIAIAVKENGPDPEGNPRLRLALSNGKGCNMPKDTITRAISKAADKDSASLFETTYEGYAPNGVAIFLEATTDNQQRTVANVRSIFNKYGGNLGTNGSLGFIFDRKGIFTIPLEGIKMDDIEMDLIDAGAEDISVEDEFITVTTAMEDFGSMMKKLEELGIQPENAALQRLPNDTVKLEVESAKKIMKIVDIFEDDDDITNVWHNMELTDELMEAME